MEHRCFKCCFFSAYYTKAYCCFLRTDCGNCDILKQTVKKHSTCENWRSKTKPEKLKKGYVLKELEHTLTVVNGIKLILEENEEERIRK